MKRVVVTGMGSITPIGCDLASYWNGLKQGVCGIAPITRFDTEGFKAKLAAEVKEFDPLQYMEKADVRRNDRFVQYALAAATQAMNAAQLAGKIDAERFGVCFGSGIGGFETFLDEHNKFNQKGPSRVSPLFITKMISNMAAGNIAIRFGAKGSCLSLTTACATGTNCIGEAYRMIRGGYLDAVIAGGVDAAITPLAIAGFTNCMALTESDDPNAGSIPFDRRRNGFVMGEGAGAVVLEEYEHAVARGAEIYAELCGYGTTCDAYHVTAIEEGAETPARAIKDCLSTMGEDIDADRIYINAHGTSTPLNDKTETKAIKLAFGADAYRVHISSTKSMTGHLLGAAGAIEAIAAVMALRENTVPPTIHYQEPDPDCDLNYTPNTALETPLDASLSISLGFGGHNACIGFVKV